MPKLSKMATLALSLLLLVGCATKGSPHPVTTEGGRPGQRVTLKVLAFPDPRLQAQINQFNDTHPDVRVDVDPLGSGSPTEISEQVAQKIRTGEADLAAAWGSLQLAQDNQLLDLKPFMAKTAFDVKPFGSLFGSLEFNGHLYEMPLLVTPTVVAYNKDLFQAAGVPVPGKAWTWADFRDAAARLTKGEGEQKVWGFDTVNLAMALNVMTGDSPDKNLRSMMQLTNTMIFTDKSMPPAPKQGESAADVDRFRDQLAAITIDRLDNLMTMSRVHWDLAPYPMWSGQSGPAQPSQGVESMVISAASKQPDAAWQFLSYLAGPDGAVVAAKLGSLNAYRTPAVKEAWFSRQPTPPTSTEKLFEADWAVGTGPVHQRTFGSMAQIQSVYMQYRAAVNSALSGERNWEDALADAQKAQEQMKALDPH